MGSKPFSLVTVDWKKIGKGALMAGSGVALTYIFKSIGDIDFGEYDVLVSGFLAVATNFVVKFFGDTRGS